ncbi:MAG TPA: hypothetical protein DCO77_12245 [Nitrospiraceae bacterium]|nr:hypothetical protein [Nitrospiraceae bacterium]
MGKRDIDFAAMLQTAINVITSPAAFFREMPRTGGFGDPLLFMVIMGGVSGLVQAIVGILGLKTGIGFGIAILSVILYPILFGVLGFIGAAFLFLLWKLMGSQESYETAYRCLAYFTALIPVTTFLDVIPTVGTLISIALYTYFFVIMSAETHKLPSQKAWVVFGALGGIVLLLNLGAGMSERRHAREKMNYQRHMEETTQEMRKRSEETRKALEDLRKQMKEKKQ